MLQRLPIALAQVKVGNTSGNWLNKIGEIIYSFYWAKEITKTNNELLIIQKRIHYFWILEIVKHLIFKDYYSI